MARVEGARRAGAGLARPRVRSRRHRFHRQRAAHPRASPRRWSATSRTVASGRARGCAASLHQRRGNRANIAAPLRRLERVLPAVARRSAWCTRARTSATTPTRSTTRRRRSSTTSAASCGSRRASACSTSAAAGAALDPLGGRALRRRRDGITLSQNQYDHVRARDRRARARGPRARRAARLPRPARRRAVTTRSRASACSSTSASRDFPTLFRQDLARAEAGRLRAEPRHHAQRAVGATASAAASAISSRSTCSRAASSRTCRR